MAAIGRPRWLQQPSAIETRNSIFICLREAAQTGINPIALPVNSSMGYEIQRRRERDLIFITRKMLINKHEKEREGGEKLDSDVHKSADDFQFKQRNSPV